MAVLAAETMRVHGVPGAEDVTDGDVDYYGTDWINVENCATEEQMQKCLSEPCGGTAAAPGNTPEQTDGQDYEMNPGIKTKYREASSVWRGWLLAVIQ